MNKLTFNNYFPKKQRRPPISQINILRYLSRFGKTRRTHIAKYFGKFNQQINDAINELEKHEIVTNYCDVCKTEIKNYRSWNDHKKSINHRINLKQFKKKDNVEKSKPLIIITKKGFQIAITDPLENNEHIWYKNKKKTFGQWGVITTSQFWNILSEIFHNSEDIENLEKICEIYEKDTLGIFRQNTTPYYFKRGLEEFKDEHNFEHIALFKDKQKQITYWNIILETIANSKSLDVTKSYLIKQIKKSYKLDWNKFDEYFDRLVLKEILEKNSHLKQEKYRITHLGLILLFSSLKHYELFFSKPPEHFEKIVNSLSKPSFDEEAFHANFENIRKKYTYLLPKILSDENFRKLNLKIFGFLGLFHELYFLDKNIDLIGNHNYHNFRLFYKIRDIDFTKKLENYLNSFEFSERSFDVFANKMKIIHKKRDKKSLKLFEKILHEQVEFINSLVQIKNEYDRLWISPTSNTSFFKNHGTDKERSESLKKKLSKKFKQERMNSIENKITFDFYSLFGKYNSGFEMNFNNDQIENWYSDQLKRLSEYITNYFDKIMF